MIRTRLSTAASIAMILLLPGCGLLGNSEADSIKQAFKACAAAYVEQDASRALNCVYLSAEEKAQVGANAANLVAAKFTANPRFNGVYRMNVEKRQKINFVAIDVKDDRAVVEFEFEGAPPNAVAMIKSDGHWKFDYYQRPEGTEFQRRLSDPNWKKSYKPDYESW
jgi:hypothetical protein